MMIMASNLHHALPMVLISEYIELLVFICPNVLFLLVGFYQDKYMMVLIMSMASNLHHSLPMVLISARHRNCLVFIGHNVSYPLVGF